MPKFIELDVHGSQVDRRVVLDIESIVAVESQPGDGQGTVYLAGGAKISLPNQNIAQLYKSLGLIGKLAAQNASGRDGGR